MLRTALRPKWLALLALALALATGFAWLGSWQWDRSRAEVVERERRAQAAQDPVPLADVLAPQQALDGRAGRATVVVRGELDASRARVSPQRDLAGRTGSWVVVPVDVDGALLAVVLGWQAGGAVPALDAGAVELTGVLRAPEAPSGSPPGDRTLQTVSTADLVNAWDAPLYSAYLVASSQDAAAAGLEAVPAEPGTGGGFDLQNVSYAVEWWVFAAFAVFLWWRMVRDEHLERTSAPRDGASEPLPETFPAADPEHDPEHDPESDPVRSPIP